MSKYGLIKSLFFLLLLLCLSCLGPQNGLYPPSQSAPAKIVYVVNQGWHTGIVFQRSDIDTAIWQALKNDTSGFQYLEVGWGDADFYQAENTTIWMGAKALFWPTSSVLHVAGFDWPVEQYFRGYDIFEIRLSEEGFRNLCTFMNQAYARDKQGEIIPLGEGLYGQNSRFYQATSKYFMTKTCNNWAATALRKAGCPITPFYACTARNLRHQLGKFGRRIGNEF